MDYSKLKNRPFMLINFVYQPAAGERTSQKNWGDHAQWNTCEHLLFVDRINQKHLVEYAVVIDLLNAVVVKSRIPDVSKAEVYAHFVNKYKNNVMQAIDMWRRKRGNELAAQMHADAIAKRIMEKVSVTENGMIQIADDTKTEN